LRVYARSLEGLGSVQERLEAELGIATSAKTREVAAVLGLGRNLDLALGLTSALATTGLAAALLFGFWSDAMRKRGALAALGMLGIPPRSLALFPVVQAVITAVLGLALSFALYAGAAAMAARMFAQGLPGEAPVTRLDWPQGMAICAAVLAIVLVAALASAWSALRVDPARTLREGH
jgi:putative ABC transport system permease protein